MENQEIISRQGESDSSIQIQDLFFLCLSKWRWFVLSLCLTLAVAVLYILSTPDVYTRTSTILIKDDSKGSSIASGMENFTDLGLFQNKTNVNNELIALQSPATMLEVVKRLHLDYTYYIPGFFHNTVAYGTTLPLTVSIPSLKDNESASFVIEVSEDGNVVLSDFVKNGEDVDSKDVKALLGGSVDTPIGAITITPTAAFKAGEEYTLEVVRTRMYNAVKNYSSNINISLIDEKKATAIGMTIEDVSIQRAEDILNTLILVYNENWVKDKNQITVSTSMFINERLKVIERDLGIVDEDISAYKTQHLIPDLQAASGLYMEQSSKTSEQLLTLNNQLYMTRYVLNYMTDKSKQSQLLPANSGIGSTSIESQIAEYNTKLLQRNGLVANSSDQNPLVKDLDLSLSEMRKAIIVSIENQITTLSTQIESLQKNEEETISKLASNPTQEQYLLSVGREQKVKEALYLFLLQKREENELSQAFTAYNTRVITPPTGSFIPTAPVTRNILLIAFVLGLMIPFGLIFLMETLNTRVRGRKDLEGLAVPFIGEIPYSFNQRKNFFSRRPKDVRKIVVKEGRRDVINEAFRVLRTNIEFMNEKDKNANVMTITSFNPGSGKSFMAVNVALCLALKDKKVLLIDGDMRHASCSAYINSPSVGLADYLNGRINNVDELLVKNEKYDSFHILPVGTIPPNPSELLFSDRLKELIESKRHEYDYIFIDCPPIEIVTDTQIIEKLADRTIFIVRAGLLERSMLPELDVLYKKNTYKNMCVILNGTKGSGRNGYRYGYGYGYGYGYHYGDVSKKQKNAGGGGWMD